MACLSLFVFLASLIVSAFPPCYVHGIISCIETERIALLSIKAGINHSYDQSLFSSWTGHDCCKWQGVSCNHQSRHVIKLDLRQHPSNVSYNTQMPPSKLNSSLIQLHHLKHLDLSMNNFNDSPIPDFIGSFPNLEYLNLSNSGFSGAIPHTFGNLSCLRYLDLSFNDVLQANDLHWLSRLTSLHHLDLSWVDLSNVHDWLHDINMLASLVVLKLSDAQLQADGGGIHDTTLLHHHLNFTSLRVLDLSWNYDQNITLPQWLFNLTSLVRLDLSGCALYGKLPVTIGNLSSLRVLSLSRNHFDGVIPESLGNLGSLEKLDLSRNKFNGSIPESLNNLTNLVNFDLSMNNISGTLPKSMGKLCKLQELDLSSNLINGAIDDFVNSLSNCPENKKSLRNSYFSVYTDGMLILNVGSNRFNGTVPESIGRLANLRTLLLQENSFDGTLTEHHFANLTDLSYMDFSYNLLQLNVPKDWVPPFDANGIMMCSCRIGTEFPAWLKTQTGLGSLCLSEAEISGNVPTWFWNLSSNNLIFLNISHNNLSGILPTLQHSFLRVIDMSHNKFEGLIPDWNSSSLTMIDLSNNSLFGPISLSFAGIEVLSLSHNHINGSIPFFLCNLTNLEALDLSSNNMSGELPHCWNQLSLLTIIDLSNNNFFGSIPEAIVSDTNLQSLHLQNNSLSGNLPLSLKNAKILVVLDIGENRLSGTIPSWIGSLVSLVVLRLRSNLFEGAIPEQLLNLSSLQVLDLAQNNLSGVIFPHTFGGFKAMATSHSERSQLFISQYDQVSIFTNGSGTYKHLESLVISAKGQQREYTKVLLFVTSIDLSCNRLSGKFPDELTSLHGLIFLNLSNNLFNGKLPENIGDMNQLESLDLSSNNFSGIIPPSISALNFLSKLNLSHNKLSGKIPSGDQLQTLDASAFFYNDGLCGYPLSNCTNVTPAQGSFHGGNQDGNGDWFDDLWLYIGLASGFIVGFWMFIVFIMIKESRRMSYFRSIDRVYDWIYVKLVIYSRRLKLILARRN